MDDPTTVHQTNVLTVVANESYKGFVAGLQRDVSESCLYASRLPTRTILRGKVLKAEEGDVEITSQFAKQICRYLVRNDYTDDQHKVTHTYHDAKEEGKLADPPPELAPYAKEVFKLIDSVFSDT